MFIFSHWFWIFFFSFYSQILHYLKYTDVFISYVYCLFAGLSYCHTYCWSLICSMFVVRMKQTALLTRKQNGERHPLKKCTYCHVQVTAIIKNIWKLTLVEVKGHLIVKGPWEIWHILSLPHSITIQNIFLHIQGISY